MSTSPASTASSSSSSSSSSSGGAATTLTFCQTYSGTTTNATAQAILLTNIVVRAATGGIFTSPSNVTYLIPGLFNASGPLYALFTGQVQYRVGAPNYVTNSAALGLLAGKLVAYFGALFGCTAVGYPAVNTYNMYAVHANMSINSAMESYFNTQLAYTLLSYGVTTSDVDNIAAPALGLFNKCAPPYAALNATAPIQICGTSDCPIATGASYSSCVQYYGYPAVSSSSTGVGSNDATGRYATSVVSVMMAAVVASLLL